VFKHIANGNRISSPNAPGDMGSQFPAPLAEGILSLWLLAFGVNVEWWTKRASGETPMQFWQMKTLR
jgi:hypothetical protein